MTPTPSIDDAWQELCARDDLTSPEEYPDMCLITYDEFAEFMSRAASPEAPPLSAAVPASGGAPTVAAWRIEHPHFGKELSFYPITEADIAAGYSMHPLYEHASLSPAPMSGSEARGEAVARRFHDIYERLAPSFGYETRKDTRQFDPTTPNGRLMIAVCSEIASALAKPAEVRWIAKEDEAQAERLKACKARRKQYGGNHCEEKDGSCDECEHDMAEALRDTPERRKKLGLPLAKPASEPADGAVREAAIGLFENFVRSTACGHVVRGLISEERAAVWTREIVEDFRASLAALSAPASSSPAEEGGR